MTSRAATASMLPTYRGYAGQEVAAWNFTGHVRPDFAHREGTTARREETEMG